MSSASIICDTNIWYSVDSLIKTDPKANLCGTLINLLELCRTPWNLDSTEVAQVACKQLIQRNKGICVYSPMKSISVISGLGVDDGNEDQIRDCMTFIAGIAEGDIIKPEKLEVFRKMIEHEQQRLTDIAAQLNALVASVRSIGIDKRDPRRDEDMTATKQFVASMVGRSIKQEVTIEQIHWEEIELFLHTMHHLHLDLEVSSRQWQPNDINDLYNLAYVGKEDLYWTLEKRWLHLIRGAGMGHYLFSPEHPSSPK